MRIILSALILLTYVLPGRTQQHPGEAEVKDVVQRLFKAMELGDSAVMRRVFTKDATLVSVFRNKAGEPVLKRDASVQQFLDAIGTPHPEPYYEEIWNVDVKIDDDLAQVWCDYAFYVGKKFSHCGVDAFHLHKTASGWKIFHLADTRRTQNCNVPKQIQDKYK